MLVAPMPPQTQTSYHYPLPLSDADRTASHAMTSTIASQPSSSSSSHSSTMSCSLSSNATTGRQPTMASRPKLTLQTSSLPRTFGSSSTGLSLSLAGGATASPTVRNTFKNAYEVAPPSAIASPSVSSSNSRFSKPSSPYPTLSNLNTNLNSNTTNTYQQPLGVKSILRNSPLEPTCRRRSGSVATNGPNGAPGTRRVFFPAKKQVSYRQPLEEEIHTVRFTARHSDLTAEPESRPQDTGSDEDSDSNSSNSSQTPSDVSTSSDDDLENKSDTSLSKSERKKRKHLSAEKQVRAVALMDGIDEDTYGATTPQTPRRKRVKRRCEWRWTLGPLELRSESTKPLPARDEATSSLETPTTPSLSNEPKPSDKETDSPASWDSLDSRSLSSISQPHSSPSSSVTSESVGHDESSRTTSHEAERANADQVE